jgi:hypothetical protein
MLNRTHVSCLDICATVKSTQIDYQRNGTEPSLTVEVVKIP